CAVGTAFWRKAAIFSASDTARGMNAALLVRTFSSLAGMISLAIGICISGPAHTAMVVLLTAETFRLAEDLYASWRILLMASALPPATGYIFKNGWPTATLSLP